VADAKSIGRNNKGKKYRSRHVILRDVLQHIKNSGANGILMTNIMFAARLSHPQIKEYLKYAKSQKMATCVDGVWRITDYGVEAIETLNSIAEQETVFHKP